MKMKVFYSRVSTIEQNDERQLQNLTGYDYILSDKCSGSIPLWERPKGRQLKSLVDNGLLKVLEIYSIDRLGRNVLDVLGVWDELTKKGVRVLCKNPTIQNLTEDGRVDKFSQLMMGILSTMSEFERNLIRERQMEGIRIRKEKGLYGGRKIGTTISPMKFLQKEKSQKIKDYLNKGYTFVEISKILKCSLSTIQKVKGMIGEDERK
jgi:DNA invertase Pin-like site-specific DNA recombinase